MREVKKDHQFIENDRNSDYWLGIIASDGYIDNNTVGLELKSTDSKTVIDFCSFNNSNSYVIRDRKGGYTQCLGKIHSRILVEYLFTKGITSAKSLNLEYKGKITWDFVRGVFDGDGTISFTKRKSKRVVLYSSSLLFINQLNNFFISEGFNTKVSMYDKRGINPFYSIWITNVSAILKFYTLLYRNSPEYFMERKYNKFLDLINYLDEE